MDGEQGEPGTAALNHTRTFGVVRAGRRKSVVDMPVAGPARLEHHDYSPGGWINMTAALDAPSIAQQSAFRREQLQAD